MLITTLRVNDFTAKAPTKPEAARQPAETFTPAFADRLTEVDAMAALALSARVKEEPKAELPTDLSAAVRAELGDTGFTTFEDERMKTLNGYLRDGWESPFYDPLATLGEGWTEQPREDAPLFQPQTFTRESQNMIQHVSFDQHGGTTKLHTIHIESFISTRHHEVVQTRDGKVTITDQRAV